MLVLRSTELPIVPDIFDRLIATEAIVSGATTHKSRSGFAFWRRLIATWA
jgi:hypothetical protein